MKSRTLVAVGLVLLLPTLASGQALTSLASVRVGYNTRKNTVRPEGDLKAQIDSLDQQIAEASRLGRNAELRRLYAKGTVLLSGRPWTGELDFENSLVLRSEHLIINTSKPYAIRLEQIYSPSLDLRHALTAHVMLRTRPVTVPGGTPRPGELVKDLQSVDDVSRDLRESPYRFELDLRDVPDGAYQVAVELFNDAASLGTATLSVALRKGLDDLVARLEGEARRAPESVRADILFPIDRMKNVDRGRLELRTFDPEKDFTAADALVSALKTKKDPFANRTGDFKRHYLLESASEIMPYRMYVPTTYTGTRAFPLIIALHGLGGTEDNFFDGYDRTFPRLAEQHGYIVAAPLGYRVDGSYGWGVGNPPADPVTRHMQELSEQDVLQVLQRVKQQYKIDDSRIYLLGHSMGAIGTWRIASRYPDIWAAIAPISGSGAPAALERIRHVPEIVVHGDNDRTVSVEGSRAMVTKMKELGIEVRYIEVPGGGHSDVVAPNFPAIFDYFDAHTKSTRSSQ